MLPSDASGAAPATQSSQQVDTAPACKTILESSYSISNQGDAVSAAIDVHSESIDRLADAIETRAP